MKAIQIIFVKDAPKKQILLFFKSLSKTKVKLKSTSVAKPFGFVSTFSVHFDGVAPYRPKHKMTAAEENFIIKSFTSSIENNETPSLWDCRKVLDEAQGQGILINKTHKHIQDKVRTLIKVRKCAGLQGHIEGPKIHEENLNIEDINNVNEKAIPSSSTMADENCLDTTKSLVLRLKRLPFTYI